MEQEPNNRLPFSYSLEFVDHVQINSRCGLEPILRHNFYNQSGYNLDLQQNPDSLQEMTEKQPSI